MQTRFTEEQYKRPEIREADEILRKCVHCGFCTATCPTYVITGDERDSPRGRIWMMRDMLESDAPASQETSFHLDRCLTCLSCMTTCPSGVDYMHLAEIGRDYVHKTTRRPLSDRLLRMMLVKILPRAGLFSLALRASKIAQPFARLFPTSIRAMIRSAPKKLKKLDPIGSTDMTYPAEGKTHSRVILLSGCAQRAIEPEINSATIRILNRIGVDVIVRKQASCCGALAHHIDEPEAAQNAVREAVRAWSHEISDKQIDAIIVNTSGCGTMLKDYGHLLKDDAELANAAATISSLACDITEFLADSNAISFTRKPNLIVGYHSACSLQHGQQITHAPKLLLAKAGVEIAIPKDPHLCCGSAGVYSILQPELSSQLKHRKLENLNKLEVDLFVAGNIGCINQLADADAPFCHIVQLLDYLSGGPVPPSIQALPQLLSAE